MPKLSEVTLRVGEQLVQAAYFRGANMAAPAVSSAEPIIAGHSMPWGQGSTEQGTRSAGFQGRFNASGGYYADFYGYPGQSSTYIKNQLLTKPELKTRPVILWLGRNNVAPARTVMTDLAEIVAYIGHPYWLILSDTPRTDETDGTSSTTNTSPRQSLNALNAAYASAYPSHYVDLVTALCTEPGHVPPASMLSDGLLHLNDAGYDLLYPIVKAAFDALVASVPSDTTPETFSFTAQTGVTPGSTVVSSAITVRGINRAAAISITGGNYRINGGSWTSAAGTVVDGAVVELQQTASGSVSTSTDTVLTIGGVSATFTTTTSATVNLVTNGAFDADTDWTKGTNVTISGGTLNFASANFQNARQNIAGLIAGATYRVTFTVSGRTSGSVYPQIFGSATANGATRSANGTFSSDIVAPASPTQFRIIGGTSNDTFSIDDVSLIKL